MGHETKMQIIILVGNKFKENHKKFEKLKPKFVNIKIFFFYFLLHLFLYYKNHLCIMDTS